jgi:hypothetical protein
MPFNCSFYLEDMEALKAYRYRLTTGPLNPNLDTQIVHATSNRMNNCLVWVKEILNLSYEKDNCLNLELIPATTFRDNAIYRLSNLIKNSIAYVPFSAIVTEIGRSKYFVAIPVNFTAGHYAPLKGYRIGEFYFENIAAPINWIDLVAGGTTIFEVYTSYPVVLLDKNGQILYVRYGGQTLEVLP